MALSTKIGAGLAALALSAGSIGSTTAPAPAEQPVAVGAPSAVQPAPAAFWTFLCEMFGGTCS